MVSLVYNYIQIASVASQIWLRGKNKKEKLGGLFKGLAKGVDEVLISGQKVNFELTYV